MLLVTLANAMKIITNPDNLSNQPLFQPDKSVKGGMKQNQLDQINDQLPYLVEIFGLDEVCRITGSKPDTILNRLRGKDLHRHPVVTTGQRAMTHSQANRELIHDMKGLVVNVAKTVADHINRTNELREILQKYFESQSDLDAMMAKLLSKMESQSNFESEGGIRVITLSQARNNKSTPLLLSGSRKRQLSGPSSSSRHRNYHHRRNIR